MGKVTIDAAHVQEYQAAAIKWRKDLLALPLLGLEDALKGMTLRTGIRYKEMIGSANLGAQMAPYKASRVTNSTNLQINYREAETFLGSVNLEFEPNAVANRIHGLDAITKGEGQKASETAKMVLAQLSKDISEGLYNALWSAKRDASGDTTATLFNGFDSIIDAEIAAGNISAKKGNYVKLTKAITAENAVDVLKEAYRKANPVLRRTATNIYLAEDLMDAYEDAYQASHSATPYNQQFEQVDLEGSRGKAKFFPMVNKADSKYIVVTPKANMLICTDQMGDTESVAVEHFAAFTLNFVMTMFFGVQFESIDPRRLLVIELAD